jgi:hypothetical protein
MSDGGLGELAGAGIKIMRFTRARWRWAAISASIGSFLDTFSGGLLLFFAYEGVGSAVFKADFRDPIADRVYRFLGGRQYPWGLSAMTWAVIIIVAVALIFTVVAAFFMKERWSRELAQAMEVRHGLPACAVMQISAPQAVRRLAQIISAPPGNGRSPLLGVVVQGGGKTYVFVESGHGIAVVESDGPGGVGDACLLGVLRRTYWLNGLSIMFLLFYISDMAHAAGKGTVAGHGPSEAIFFLACWLGLRLWASVVNQID